jgi:hypothetical protein
LSKRRPLRRLFYVHGRSLAGHNPAYFTQETKEKETMMNLKPEVVAQLERVLSSVEMLLPKAVKQVDWSTCHAANWRRHSFSGYLEAVKVTDTTRLEELLGVDEQKTVMVNNTRQFLQGLPATTQRIRNSGTAHYPGRKGRSDLYSGDFFCRRRPAIPFYHAL